MSPNTQEASKPEASLPITITDPLLEKLLDVLRNETQPKAKNTARRLLRLLETYCSDIDEDKVKQVISSSSKPAKTVRKSSRSTT